MSERSCENCSSRTTWGGVDGDFSCVCPRFYCQYLPQTDYGSDTADKSAAKALAAVCKYYAEREELCDHALRTNERTYHCELEKGHGGRHRWSDETMGVTWPTRPGFTFSSSNMCATEVPTPFEKAWEKDSPPGKLPFWQPGTAGGLLQRDREKFRAGWQARGRATGEALDALNFGGFSKRLMKRASSELDAEAECK